MAHDNQYKDNDNAPDVTVVRFDHPKAGESYWDRTTRKVAVATGDEVGKFLIVKVVE